MKPTLFLVLLLAVVNASHFQLCSYSDTDTMCSASLVCQDFEMGVCTRHQDCDQTGICYGVVVREDETSNSYRVKNYFVDNCPQTSFALEAQLSLGVCEQEVVGNFTYHARLNAIEHSDGGLSSAALIAIGFAAPICIAGLALLVWCAKTNKCCWKEKQSYNPNYAYNNNTSV